MSALEPWTYLAAVALQLAALAFCLLMVRQRTIWTPWAWMSAALFVMLVFRVIRLMTTGPSAPLEIPESFMSPFAAVTSLCVSAFLLVSLFAIRNLSASQQAATSALEQAKQTSERSLEQLQAVIEAMTEGLIIADPKGEILTMNPAARAMLEFKSEADVFHTLKEYPNLFEVADESGQPLSLEEWPLSRVIRGERFVGYEVYVRRRDTGRRIIGSFGGTPIRKPDGQTIRLALLTFREVTEAKRHASELAESRQRLQSLFDTTQDCILLSNDEAQYVDANPAACKLTGYTREQLLERHLWDLTPVPNRELGAKLWKSFLAAGKLSGEYDLCRQDGSIVSVEYRAAANILPGLHLSILRDVTQRRRFEDALRENAERLSLALDSAQLGDWQWDPATDAVTLSPRAAEIFGVAADTKVTRSAMRELIHEADREAARLAAEQTLVAGVDYNIEYRVNRPDGRQIWVAARGRGRYGSDGKLITMLGVVQDITERKAVEEGLRESEERLRLGLQAGEVGTWDWDIVNDRLTWSERTYAFHGLSQSEFGGSVPEFLRLIHPDDYDRVASTIRQTLADRSPYQIDFRIIQPSGQVRWLTTSGRVYYGADAKPVRMLGGTRDVTLQKIAEQQRDALLQSEREAREAAEQNSRIKDEFLATLSHELRTPLTAIMGWAHVLLAGPPDPADLAQGLQTIERNAKSQTRIIEDLLDMSRIVSGKIRLDVQRIELLPVLEAAMETVRPAANAKGVALELATAETSTIVSADSSRLQQVFWNLLSNAVKFSRNGGAVRVEVKRRGNLVDVVVTDNGEGIQAEFLPFVFDRFRQADGSITRRHAGLGLGLSIVRQLVELHGGVVSAASSGANTGAVFTVSLPAINGVIVEETNVQPPVTNNIDAPETCDGYPKLAGLDVLIVDDDPDTRVMVRKLLEDYHARVRTAESVPEALELIQANPPQVLISDIGMPGYGGFWLIQQVRALPADSGGTTPAIALTAYAREEDRLQVIRAGFQRHVAKPVEPAVLFAAVEMLAGTITPSTP